MKFKVYSAQITKFGPQGLIIVACYKERKELKSEHFLVLPDNDKLYSRSISYNTNIPKDLNFKFDKKFVLNESLNQAKLDLGEYLTKLADKETSFLVNGLIVNEKDASFIAHLLFTDRYDSIKTITNITECNDLLLFLNSINNIKIRKTQN